MWVSIILHTFLRIYMNLRDKDTNPPPDPGHSSYVCRRTVFKLWKRGHYGFALKVASEKFVWLEILYSNRARAKVIRSHSKLCIFITPTCTWSKFMKLPVVSETISPKIAWHRGISTTRCYGGWNARRMFPDYIDLKMENDFGIECWFGIGNQPICAF